MRVLFTDPVDYLVTPRVLASMIAGPILNVLCFCMGEGLSAHARLTRRTHVMTACNCTIPHLSLPSDIALRSLLLAMLAVRCASTLMIYVR